MSITYTACKYEPRCTQKDVCKKCGHLESEHPTLESFVIDWSADMQQLSSAEISKNFEKVVDRVYKPVAEETGWKVVINGVWVQKSNPPGKILYASRDAAKNQTEAEFKGAFYEAINETNDSLWENARAYGAVTDYYKTQAKLVRKIFDILYAKGIIQYIEV